MMGSACTGACLLERSRAGGQDTQVARQRRALRWLLHRVLPAAPDPPLELFLRTRGVSPPPVHLLHECTINIMDA
jgi:hypothetical protein